MNAARIRRVERLTESDSVKSRAELMWWLCHNGAVFSDIMRAGNQWVIIHAAPARICATGIRCIDGPNLGEWLSVVRDTTP